MSEHKDDGGPAFPGETWNGDRVLFTGMTLRDWFAGQALARMAEFHRGEALDPLGVANAAYEHADAMILL